MKLVSALGMNDVRTIRRDSLLTYLLIAPWILVLFLRLLSTYPQYESFYPVALALFIILEIPMLAGVAFGFLMLDERDDRILTALQVTPVSVNSYTLYRIITTTIFSFIYVMITLPVTGLMDNSLWVKVIPVALVASLFSIVTLLLLVGFANNKVEGLAIMKAFGIMMIGPLADFWIASDWKLLLGILPTYWPVKAFWLILEGETAWLYLGIGLIYALVWILALYKRFDLKLRQLG